MRRALSRPPWVPWVLLTVGAFGLLLPWLLAPVPSDERYHYPAAPGRTGDNVLGVLPWAVNDMEWRMRAGRIAPVGVVVQHVIYLLGMQFAFSTGVPLFVVHGMVKLGLALVVVGAFALLLTQLRRRTGDPIDPATRRSALTLFTILLLLGVTTTSPGRNGWVSFVVLCMGGIALMFLVGAVCLWTLRTWGRWGSVGRAAAAVALAVLGVGVMLSYEMHWAAVPFALVMLAFIGCSPWRHRLVVGLPLGGGWLAAVLWTRHLIGAAAESVYVGLQPDLGGPVLKVIGLQLVNALPGTGIPYSLHSLGAGLPTPRPFAGTGWLWGALFAVGIVLLLAKARLSGTSTADEDRQPLVVLAGALGASALSAAVILSVSEQAHQIVRFVGATYRGTPWIWSCLAGALAVALLVVPRTDWTRRVVSVTALATAAVLVGVLGWPTTVAALSTQRATADYVIFERAQAELITGSADPVAVENRCRIADQAKAWAGESAYRRSYLPIYERAFRHQWGRPWCS